MQLTALGFSNICNLIAQQTGFLGYHFGYESDMYRNVDNNTNVGNSVGRQYPFVLLEPIESTLVVTSKTIRSSNRIRLNFFAPQHYDNLGAQTSNTTNEQMQVLRDLAMGFLQVLFAVGATNAAGFSIEGGTVTMDTQESQTPDRLLQIVCTLSVFWIEPCPTVTFETADINPAFDYPVLLDTDYERLTPTP